MNQPPPPDVPAWSTRQVVYATLFIVAVLAAFWLLYRFSQVLFILFVAIVLGTAIRPVVEWLNRRGISRTVSVLIIYFLLLSIILAVIFAVVPIVFEQVSGITTNLPKYYGDFRNLVFQSKSRILQQIAIQLPPELRYFSTPKPAAGASETEQAVDQVALFLSYMGGIARGILTLVAIFLLGLYWTLESERTIRSILLWFPINRREDARAFITQIEAKVGGFILGQSILCLTIGVMATIAYMLIGLPYALVLGILAGILEAVPVLGPILGSIPPILLALSIDPSKVIWVIVAAVVIQQSENYLLVPRVMNRSVGVRPFVTLLALAAFTSLLGLPGAVLAVPMAAIIQLIIDRFVLEANSEEQAEPIGRSELSVLHYEAQDLMQDMRKQFREKDGRVDEIEDSLESIVLDLNRILAEADQKES